MNELKNYVGSLFAKYGRDRETDELKAEILSNLEARKADLIAGGMDEKTAIVKAKESITSIDDLISGNKNIYISRYTLERLQTGLLYLVIAWIATIPVTIFRETFIINSMLLCAVIITGIAYIIRTVNKHDTNPELKQYINIKYYYGLKQKVWIIWGAFITISLLCITGLYFASNIWFSRPIHIDGPYMFATIAARYFLPFVTIVVPMFVNSLPKLILKYEAGEADEE